MDRREFVKEIIAFCKCNAKHMLDNISINTISGTQNLCKVNKALCDSIKTPNLGSVMSSILVWFFNCAKKYVYAKLKGNAAASAVESINEFEITTIDFTGKGIYVGIANIVK